MPDIHLLNPPMMSRIILCLTAMVFFISGTSMAQSLVCQQRGTYPMPTLSTAARQRMEAQLDKARADALSSKGDADAQIWLGRRLAYLGHYHDAIDTYGMGKQVYPGDARFLRHRGHRWITLRCLDSAVNDLTLASRWVKGKPDEVEPDGMPNDKNIPTSTLQSNIWYHLGLAYYLKGDYNNAVKAYRSCLNVSKNNDMYIATANWYHLSLKKAGKHKAAARFLKTIDPSVPLIENEDYLSLLNLYIEQTEPSKALQGLLERKELSSASYGYGLGEYLLSRGDREGAKEVFTRISSDPSNWSSFGYMAAENALRTLK
jgi:tetratricopeptide (TPR) repeat protein